MKQTNKQTIALNSIENKAGLSSSALVDSKASMAVRNLQLNQINFKSSVEQIDETKFIKEGQSIEHEFEGKILKSKDLLPSIDYTIKALDLSLKNATTEEEEKEITSLKEIMQVGKDVALIPVKQNKSEKLSFLGVREDMRNERLLKSLAVCQAAAVSASATAGSLAQTGVLDTAAVTTIQGAMCAGIAAVYGIKNIKNVMTAVSGPAVLSVVGPQIAVKFISWFPGFGNAANAAVAYGTTTTLGVIFTGLMEITKERGLDIEQMTPEEISKYAKEANANKDYIIDYWKTKQKK
ncbi:MAG: hypothetical protein WCK67_07420 [bacterium]